MSNYNKALKETKQDVEEWYDLNNWEEVPTEELWEDGELNERQVQNKVLDNLFYSGDWRLIRRKEKDGKSN